MSVFLRQLSTEDDVTRAQTSSDHFVTFSSMFSPATKPPESLATGALVGIIIGSIFGLLLVSSAILLITTKKRWLALLSVSRGGDFVQQEADADSKAEISSVTNVSTMELCDIKTTVCDCLPAHVSQSPISTIATASDYSLMNSSSDTCLTKISPATSEVKVRDGWSRLRVERSDSTSMNGMDNPVFYSRSFDDYDTASALATPSVCVSTEDGSVWPDTDRLTANNFRRSYRLDGLSAMAIAAQRNRESSVYDAEEFATVGEEVVIVYNERTSL